MNVSPQLSLPLTRFGAAISMILLAEAYFLAAELSVYLHTGLVGSPALILPAAGIAMAGLYLGGSRLWPAVALASFISVFLADTSFVYALGIAAASTLQAYAGAYLLNRMRLDTLFARVRDVTAISVTSIVVTLIVPTIGIGLRYFLALPVTGGYFSFWLSWWVGETLSVLLLVPLIVRWTAHPRISRGAIGWVEIIVSFVSLFVINYVLFFTHYTTVVRVPLVYLLFFPLMWIALRIGPRFMTLALFVEAVLVLPGAIVGPEAATMSAIMMADRVFQSEILLIFLSLIFLPLVAVAEERKNNANELRVHIARLEKAIDRIGKEDEAKSQFIATLAHELRNPLAPLMSSLEILALMESRDGMTGEIINDMTGHIQTMRHLLDDLLDVSRIARQKFALQTEAVELSALVHQSVRSVSALLAERNHTLSVSLSEQHVVFEADPVRLAQVIVNLLNNAAKYTKPGGMLSLESSINGDEIILRVKDNGMGIEATQLEHIFEPFHQVGTRTQQAGGIGIGLSLTKTLVEMHGGTIRAQSEGLGRGSEFIVHIPFINRTESSESPMEQLPEEARAGHRILVVDDNRSAAHMLQKLLTLRGHNVKAAFSGGEALAVMEPFAPEIVLLDIGLPDIDGYGVARAIRANAYPLRLLVALSGYGQDEDKRKALEVGFDTHLTKPVGLAELEALFAELD